ncbi:MAG: restriction endonuclease subunit S [Gammaproteobacteria bacterium]|nr:restriction endonuclease subunit S [Gammaproteobacteria bacterium]
MKSSRRPSKNTSPLPPGEGQGEGKSVPPLPQAGEGWGEGASKVERKPLAIREGPIAPYLAKPPQARHSRESGNPVRLVPLGELGRWTGGGTPSKANAAFWTNGTIPWVSPKDMKVERISTTQDHITEEAFENSATQKVAKGAILIVVRSGILKHSLPVAIADRDVALNQDLKAIELKDGFLPEYVAWAIRASSQHILHTCAKSGTTVQNLEMPRLLRHEIPVVPLAEQRGIVAELETQLTRLDASGAALKRVQANLKRYRASVLKAACEGRLVPTEAELARSEGRSFESGSELLERILNHRREQWTGRGKYKEAAIPTVGAVTETPEGWAWTTVEQLSTKVVDGVHKKPKYVSSGIPFVTVRNLTAGPGISFDKLNYVSPQDHKEFIKRANPENGDILISKDGTLGVVRAIKTDAVFSIFVSVAMIKPVVREMSSFLEIALSAPQVQRQMVPKGSGLQHIHLEDLREDCIPLPPLSEQHRIVAEVERRFSVLEKLETTVAANLKRAERLRQSILADAFMLRQTVVDELPA